MSKKKKLNVSKKPADTLPKDSINSPSLPVSSPSPQETTSERTSVDFANAINESRQHIAAAEEEKSKRGRKKLPRDAQGNIIRSDAPGINPAQTVPLNQASVAETKALLMGFVIPMASGAAVKYALDDEKAAIPEEQKEPWATATAEELESWFPGLSSKYMRLGTVLGLPVMWFLTAKNLRAENMKKILDAQKVKTEIKDGQLPVEGQ